MCTVLLRETCVSVRVQIHTCAHAHRAEPSWSGNSPAQKPPDLGEAQSSQTTKLWRPRADPSSHAHCSPRVCRARPGAHVLAFTPGQGGLPGRWPQGSASLCSWFWAPWGPAFPGSLSTVTGSARPGRWAERSLAQPLPAREHRVRRGACARGRCTQD